MTSRPLVFGPAAFFVFCGLVLVTTTAHDDHGFAHGSTSHVSLDEGGPAWGNGSEPPPFGHVLVRVNCSVSCTSRDAIRQLRIDSIKRDILQKLRITTMPNVSRSAIPDIPIVSSMMSSVQGDGGHAPLERTTRPPSMYRGPGATGRQHAPLYPTPPPLDLDPPTSIFTFAERVPADVTRNAPPSAIYFRLDQQEMARLDLLDATLGLRVTRMTHHARDVIRRPTSLVTLTLTVSKVNRRGGTEHYAKKKLYIPDADLHFSQWVELSVMSLVQSWVDQPDSNLGLVVEIASSQNRAQFQLVTLQTGHAAQPHKPYLELTVRDRRSPRARRTPPAGRQDCDERGVDKLCCRYPLIVNFETFGWDWIIAPRQYPAFFCAGDCPFAYINTYVTQQTATTTAVKTGGGPCCSPRELSPISLLYFDATMRIQRGYLPDMVVNRCSCT